MDLDSLMQDAFCTCLTAGVLSYHLVCEAPKKAISVFYNIPYYFGMRDYREVFPQKETYFFNRL